MQKSSWLNNMKPDINNYNFKKKLNLIRNSMSLNAKLVENFLAIFMKYTLKRTNIYIDIYKLIFK